MILEVVHDLELKGWKLCVSAALRDWRHPGCSHHEIWYLGREEQGQKCHNPGAQHAVCSGTEQGRNIMEKGKKAIAYP